MNGASGWSPSPWKGLTEGQLPPFSQPSTPGWFVAASVYRAALIHAEGLFRNRTPFYPPQRIYIWVSASFLLHLSVLRRTFSQHFPQTFSVLLNVFVVFTLTDLHFSSAVRLSSSLVFLLQESAIDFLVILRMICLLALYLSSPPSLLAASPAFVFPTSSEHLITSCASPLWPCPFYLFRVYFYLFQPDCLHLASVFCSCFFVGLPSFLVFL